MIVRRETLKHARSLVQSLGRYFHTIMPPRERGRERAREGGEVAFLALLSLPAAAAIKRLRSSSHSWHLQGGEATNICSVPSSRTFPRSLSQTLARQARFPLVRNPFRHIMSQKTSSFALADRSAWGHFNALPKLPIEDITFPFSFRLITGIRTISCPIDRDSFTGEWRKRPRGPRRGRARTRRLRQRRLRGRWRR